MTEMGHTCVLKALKTVGLFEAIIRKVPMDENFRMEPQLLRESIRQDKKDGLIPFLVVATIGTTSIGSVDPIDEIANVAEEYNLWLHVDAAYGGFFVLVDDLNHLFKGVNRANSLVVNPHKSLFLPYGISVVIIRDGSQLRDANSLGAEGAYLQDFRKPLAEESPYNLSFEYSRHFRGLRMWLSLQLYGVSAFREALREKISLTHYAYTQIREIQGFVIDCYPQLTAFTFYYETGDIQQNESFNAALQENILGDGSFFITSTRIKSKYRLRICILHFRSNKTVIDDFLEVLRRETRKLVDDQ
ncbi:tryptophan decarboxylase-like [Ptychodera flava]|uniref:tryptophan decarboxylase-like n=1 Tax=Ptychodera flava TaxID=63121 RepID=UPI00396A569F